VAWTIILGKSDPRYAFAAGRGGLASLGSFQARAVLKGCGDQNIFNAWEIGPIGDICAPEDVRLLAKEVSNGLGARAKGVQLKPKAQCRGNELSEIELLLSIFLP